MSTFLTNLKWRRAEKHFSPGHVDTTLIEKAIVNAPTSYGMQPFHVLRITSNRLKKELRPACNNQAQVTECYALFIFCARTDLDKRADEFLNAKKPSNISAFKRAIVKFLNKRCGLSGNSDSTETDCDLSVEWAKRQAYIALGYALAAATELKIASCPMEGFKADKVKKVLNMDDKYEPCVLLAVGRKNNDYKLEPRFRFPADELIKRIEYEDIK
jgi:nitroreductase/dihydropteridine reductase